MAYASVSNEGDRVTFANRAAGKSTGVKSGDPLAGQPIHALLSMESHTELRRQMDHALRHQGEMGSLQAHLRRGNSDVREIEIARNLRAENAPEGGACITVGLPVDICAPTAKTTTR